MTLNESTSAAKNMNNKPATLDAVFAKIVGFFAGPKGTTVSENTLKNARRDVFEDLHYPNETVLRS